MPTQADLLKGLAVHTFVGRDWTEIKSVCKGQSGVYCFLCESTGYYYIGSAVDLYNRLRDYHQPWFIATNGHLPIMRAIAKYGMHSFTILILQFTEYTGAVTAEQVWLDEFKPRYNVLALAASSLGYKHTEEGKKKISEASRGKALSEETKDAISKRQTGSGNTFYGKVHTDEVKAQLRAHALARTHLHKPGYPVVVTDTETGSVTTYRSLRAAASALRCTRTSLDHYNGRLFRNRYLISTQG